MRKSLIKFDDVVNEQRKIVFNQRNRIISDDDLKILDVVRQVNLKILSDAKSKNFYRKRRYLHKKISTTCLFKV